MAQSVSFYFKWRLADSGKRSANRPLTVPPGLSQIAQFQQRLDRAPGRAPFLFGAGTDGLPGDGPTPIVLLAGCQDAAQVKLDHLAAERQERSGLSGVGAKSIGNCA